MIRCTRTRCCNKDDQTEIPIISTVKVLNVELKLKGEMRGMTVVDDQLFAVESEDLVVKVYDLHTLKSRPHIPVPDMKDPQGLAGCSHNKFLYISDGDLECIHRVKITDASVKRWKLNDKYKPLGISVRPMHNILVTVKTMYTCRILEYTSEGQLMRDTEINGHIKFAWQTVQLLSHMYVIYEGWGDSTSSQLSAISPSDSGIFLTYGGRIGRGEGQLREARSLAMDNNKGLLFVADANRVLMFRRNLTLVGQIQTRHFSNPKYLHYDSNPDRLILGSSIIKHRYLVGLTVVDDEVFAVYSLKSYICVYDAYTLTDQSCINTPDMKDPTDLSGCSHNKALYISDEELRCIQRVNISDNSVEVWRLRENCKPYGLSVTSDHNLLVTVRISENTLCMNSVEVVEEKKNDDNNIGADYLNQNFNCGTCFCKILEYTSWGKLLRDIDLDKSIDWAWQTVQLSSDQFIICHGWRSSLHRLCVVNFEGQVTKSYGAEAGSDKLQFNLPRSLTIDNSRGEVLVSDRNNNRVLIFNSDLTLLREMQIRDDLSKPSCLCFDVSSDRLFLGEWGENGRMLIVCSPD